jgi:hypothetical protein
MSENNTQQSALAVRDEHAPVIANHLVSLDRLGYEPRSSTEAFALAKQIVSAHLFEHLKTPEQTFLILMQGRELGLSSMQAISNIDVIRGKPTLAAKLMTALVRSSGLCEYLDCTEMTPERATWVTKRKGSPREVTVSFTIEEAADMELLGRDQWKKQKATMLMWRAASRICRMVYSDVILGLYDSDEARDFEEPTQRSPYPPSAKSEAAPDSTNGKLLAYMQSTASPRPEAAEDTVVDVSPVKPAPVPVAPAPSSLSQSEPQSSPSRPPEEAAPVAKGKKEPKSPKTSESAADLKKELGRVQKLIVDVVGEGLAKEYWLEHVGSSKGVEDTAKIKELVQKAKDLSRRVELVDIINGHRMTVHELTGEKTVGIDGVAANFTLDQLEQMEVDWHSRAVKARGDEPPADSPGEQQSEMWKEEA